ncbi:MAG: carboxypeptidase regulatory-like domain-containing protein [Acidobacteriota bacterium]
MKRILLGTLLLGVTTALHGGDIHGKVVCSGLSSSADAVVYVGAIPGKTFPPPAEHAKMDQLNKVFQPHLLAVPVGTTVDFLNDDPFGHNVFTPDACAGKFNLGTYPKGEKRSHTFSKECFATILCIVHPEMDAYVAALPTRYFAVTNPDGSYEIKDVPDGSYTLKVWHPKLKGAGKTVSVHGATQADFQMAR